MPHEFQSTLYPTARAMCDAIAYEWMTAGGDNTSADIDEYAAQGAQFHAEECIEGWGLLRVVDDDTGRTWLDEREADAGMVLRAFERFFAGRPDREMSDAERAESWYNGSSKAALIDWATRHGLDIGQGRAQLDDDWNERVMQAYAAQL